MRMVENGLETGTSKVEGCLVIAEMSGVDRVEVPVDTWGTCEYLGCCFLYFEVEHQTSTSSFPLVSLLSPLPWHLLQPLSPLF